MQAPQFIDSRLDDPVISSNIFGELFPLEDCKSEVPIYQEKTLDDLDQIDLKKKGRPKG